jgi:hypothetical protein
MSDFPVVLTNAVDGVPGVGTPIAAKHLNDLEAKVGINGSAVTTSLDYLLRSASSIEPGHKHNKLWSSDGTFVSVVANAMGRVGITTDLPSQLFVASDLYSTAMFFQAGNGESGFGASDYDENGIPFFIDALSHSFRINSVEILKIKSTSVINIVSITPYANNAAALSGGLVAGDLYRLGDTVGVVH